jgi:uncharacterized membrane protein
MSVADKLNALLPQILLLIGSGFFVAGIVLGMIRTWRGMP